jgi:hypothetical protein
MADYLLMKIIYLVLILCAFLSAACNSPVNKQHDDKRIKANTLQNNSAEATTDPENNIGSGNLTDSTHRIDTGARQ